MNINSVQPQIESFSGKVAKEQKPQQLKYTKDTLLENNFKTKMEIQGDKLVKAFTTYPAKGLKGDKNANFYEFLTMGTVPYLLGSAALMTVFNAANKFFTPFAQSKAGSIGKKMALGVAFYGVAKEASKALVNKPVKALTGVDTEMPYAKVVEGFPKFEGDTNTKSIEYHKVFESVEFPRYDLLYGKTNEDRNAYYDKVAKKLGLGENLASSDKEVKPRLKEIIARSNTAKSISSYLWAATGVGLAIQKPWDNFFTSATKGQGFAKVKNMARSFGNNFVKSAKDLWTGGANPTKVQKYAGKALIGAAVAATVIGVANTVINARKSAKLEDKNIFDENRKVVLD
ncbi:hypothetical protein IJ843_05640 [bacterium]|nr:hypothetical protein [bacterium]